jgi:hypothetical protein
MNAVCKRTGYLESASAVRFALLRGHEMSVAGGWYVSAPLTSGRLAHRGVAANEESFACETFWDVSAYSPGETDCGHRTKVLDVLVQCGRQRAEAATPIDRAADIHVSREPANVFGLADR